MARLGVAIVGVIIINGIFSFWQEYKAERAVAALRQLLPQKVRRCAPARSSACSPANSFRATSCCSKKVISLPPTAA
jgi:hypothetical protein